MIDRRTFIHGIALAVLTPPLLAEARPVRARRVPRIGILGEVNPISWMVRTSAVEIECRWAEGQRHRLPDLATELVNREVDVIVAAGAEPARAAKKASRSIPVVFVAEGDPVAEGLVASVGRPGGNVTGLSVLSEADIVKQRLRLLSKAAPGLDRIAILSNPDNPSSEHVLGRLGGRDRHAVEARSFTSRSAEDIEEAFVAMRKERVGGLLVLPDTLFSVQTRRILDLAAENRLPAVYGARSFAEAGGLMALHGDTAEVIRRTVAVVARILGGAAPGTLPVESLARLELTMNLETARTLGLSPPGSLLARADRLIRC